MNTTIKLHSNIRKRGLSSKFKEKLGKEITIGWNKEESRRVKVTTRLLNFLVTYDNGITSRKLYDSSNLPDIAAHLSEEGLSTLVAEDINKIIKI